MNQLVSQVRPPSAEKACCQVGRSGIPSVPAERDEDGPPGVLVLASKHSLVAVEPAHDRREEPRPVAVDPVDPPEPVRQVEQAQRHALEEVPFLHAGLVDVAEAAEDPVHHGAGLELVPFVRAREPLAQAPVADHPFALEEVEVARAGGQGGVHAVGDREERHARVSRRRTVRDNSDNLHGKNS